MTKIEHPDFLTSILWPHFIMLRQLPPEKRPPQLTQELRIALDLFDHNRPVHPDDLIVFRHMHTDHPDPTLRSCAPNLDRNNHK